jgi:hypothetical protein
MRRSVAALAPAIDEAAPPAQRWQELFGGLPPQRLASLVERAVAWQEQVLLHGDVLPQVAHDLKLAAEHALAQRSAGHALVGEDVGVSETVAEQQAPAPPPLRVSTTPRHASRRRAPLPPATSQLLPGSQLIKAHGGRNHVVQVEAGGFRYEGELFSSLSAIAKHITGTHWNGLLFFGLRKRRTYPAKPRNHG